MMVVTNDYDDGSGAYDWLIVSFSSIYLKTEYNNGGWSFVSYEHDECKELTMIK